MKTPLRPRRISLVPISSSMYLIVLGLILYTRVEERKGRMKKTMGVKYMMTED